MKRKYIKIAVLIWLTVLALIVLAIIYVSQWWTVAIPFSFPIIATGSILQWDDDFRNADYATKRKMAKILNEPEEFPY